MARATKFPGQRSFGTENESDTLARPYLYTKYSWLINIFMIRQATLIVTAMKEMPVPEAGRGECSSRTSDQLAERSIFARPDLTAIALIFYQKMPIRQALRNDMMIA